ncbi:MAG: homocysteine S-methyltransferase family protein [Actinomycetia bacterium]|nr:homocysteine S-methyltransferase family protein [Actinomycetes bacterium]MCP4086491.1 homocysteine S-methyltransferase family protein [Actinomycetes bacterium]
MSDPQITLLDGGIGNELGVRGLKSSELWATLALISDPDTVRSVHLDYILAGARVITTNTYSCVPFYLSRMPGLLERADELIDLAGRLANEARADSGVPGVRIAGSLPPLDESYRPDLVHESAELVEWYERMVAALLPHVDLFLCETMSTISESVAAVGTASGHGRPVWVAWTVSDELPGALRSGESIIDAVEAVAEFDPAAHLLNCSTPEVIEEALPILRDAVGGPIGAYANAYPPVPKDFHLEQSTRRPTPEIDPDHYVACADRWIGMGAEIVGGCCGIGPAHIAAVHQVLD